MRTSILLAIFVLSLVISITVIVWGAKESTKPDWISTNVLILIGVPSIITTLLSGVFLYFKYADAQLEKAKMKRMIAPKAPVVEVPALLVNSSVQYI